MKPISSSVVVASLMATIAACQTSSSLPPDGDANLGSSSSVGGTGGAPVPGASGGSLGTEPDPTLGFPPPTNLKDPELSYPPFAASAASRQISRAAYYEKLQGFWLGLCIANWTGLITEFDRVAAPFYTDLDWGMPDEPSIWGTPGPKDTIDFFLTPTGTPWGADDDSDIEYIYQHLLDTHNTSFLSPEQIRDGWLTHIYSNEDGPVPSSEPGKERENYLWVSNETAYYLMKDDDLLPPATSLPENNANFDKIDAQLTTELFGLFAPTRPDVGLKMAELAIRTTAYEEAEWAAEFYVNMYSNASLVDPAIDARSQVMWLADQAKSTLPEGSYVRDMYDFILSSYQASTDKSDWESTRDAVYQRYQLSAQGATGYDYDQGFDAGINFAAGLVSLFFGEGDFKKTVQIGALAGWDSDNPTATWGGLLGFLLGRKGVEALFPETTLSETFHIHRTRRNFPDLTATDPGEDSFPRMAEGGLYIIDRVIIEELGGSVDLDRDIWAIPTP